MDTSLNVQVVATGVAKSPPRAVNTSPNMGQVSAARQSQAGKVLPQDSNLGLKLPLAAEKKDAAEKAATVTQRDQLSRMAVALVTELGSRGNVERTEQAVAKLNEILKDRERDLEFSVDEDTGRTVLKVIHAESGEVIRQIPPEELLHIARVFIEGTGSLIDDQA
ncbi:flagellar protein FlaG [Zhongshania arctica]|uniref:Flagellar protein FlaG n=1 Tax=Zhongshania arctica TaxID=3238302 RepID=A0ABV3TW32_9GAMM